MSDDFYTMVDSGDPAPDNEHITGVREERDEGEQTAVKAPAAMYAARIAVYDDMLSTPRVIVIEPQDVRTYLEETTNTVYQCMKEQGGHISLMVIREIVENFIHAHFAEPIISILDGGDTIRFADQGPGIDDKERAFDFGVTSANSKMKRYIRGTGAGFPMVQEYLENAGGAVSIEDNMGNGTVVTVSLNPKRVQEIERAGGRGAAVRPETEQAVYPLPGAFTQQPMAAQQTQPPMTQMQQPGMLPCRGPRRYRCRCPQTLQRACLRQTRMSSPSNNRQACRAASKWVINRTRKGIHTNKYRSRGTGTPSSIRNSTRRDTNSRTSRCLSSSTTHGRSRYRRSLTSSGRKVFNSRCRPCRVLNNQQLKWCILMRRINMHSHSRTCS